MYYFYGKVNRGHVVCPLYRGGLYLRESVTGGSTVFSIPYDDSQTVKYQISKKMKYQVIKKFIQFAHTCLYCIM